MATGRGPLVTWTSLALVLAAVVTGQAWADPSQKPAKPAKAAAARTPTPLPAPRPAIRVEIEQEGRALPVADHRVVLKLAPFDILLTLAPGDSVELRASSRSPLFQTARSGRDLGGTFVPSQTSAEGQGNPDRTLFIDSAFVQHSFSYDPKDPFHKFNEVVPKGGLFRCRRSVARLGIDDPVTVEAYPAPSLYLVFLAGKPSKDYKRTIESGREYLMLTFEDATADLPPPRRPAKQRPMDALVAFAFAKDVATLKAYLPDGLTSQASRIGGPVDQQIFFEDTRLAETLRSQGWRVEQRGKASKPELRMEAEGKPTSKAVCEKERIQGEEATIECKIYPDGSKEARSLLVRMILQKGSWRLGGIEGAGPGPATPSPWARLDDGEAFERLLTDRRKANESGAIGDLRTLISAQSYVSSTNGGFYLPPECLDALETCIAGYTGPPASAYPFPWALPRNGYRWTFRAGPRPSSQEIKKAKASASSLRSYAVVLVPEAPGKSGTRAFCGDDSVAICVTEDGSAPAVRNGACVKPCNELK